MLFLIFDLVKIHSLHRQDSSLGFHLSNSSVPIGIPEIEISVFNGFSKPRLSSIFVDRELHKSHIISRGRGKERPKLARILY
ncbi:hypothetical protein CISIN_1g042411mg [Citrus sinensis]|uniref:Uncharacterized protein n=1 Tax=Citrus sinensis TaxID=2711 RepID=A0A067D3G3_CITSI|nr:hypothetical protein CISIN_1g042411mg [Citrus sinensis]